MNELENKRSQMLTRVREFGSVHANDFPADSFGGQTFSEVGAVVTELAGYDATQTVGRGGARESTVSKATARAALYEHLLAINLTVRARWRWTSRHLRRSFGCRAAGAIKL